MGLNGELLDDGEDLRRDPNSDIVWEGVPLVNEKIYNVALILLIVSIAISFLYLISFYKGFTETFLIIVISTGSIYFMALGVFIIMLHDYYAKKRKAKYVLQKDKLIIRDGNKLTTKSFVLEDVEKAECRSYKKYVTVILKYTIRNPFTFGNAPSREFKIGPFNNPEEIVGIINEEISKKIK